MRKRKYIIEKVHLLLQVRIIPNTSLGPRRREGRKEGLTKKPGRERKEDGNLEEEEEVTKGEER